MSFTTASVPAVELAALADDRPLLIGANALDRPAIAAKWRDSNTSLAFTSFENSPTGAYLVHSRGGSQRARPLNLGLSLWFLLFEVTGEFDLLALWNHNLASIPSLVARLELANTIDYGSGLATALADFAPTAGRHIAYHLGGGGTPLRYTGTGYGRLRLSAPAPFVPEIGGVWLGRRRQLRRGPDVPYDERERISRVLSAGDGQGFEVTSPMFAGRRVLRATLTPDDSAATLRDTDTLRAWWRESRQGSAPFLWARAPSSAPTDVALFKGQRGMSVPLLGPVIRTAQLDAVELPPFLAAEGL